MKLSYWIVPILSDNPCYSIRGKTRKECQQKLAEAVADGCNPLDYGAPRRVELEYDSGFDLMEKCLSGEDRGYWEE